MEKEYTKRYPEKGQEQYKTITDAIVMMLNCRRYLASEGFNESYGPTVGPSEQYAYSNGISGSIVFPSGLKITASDFSGICSSSGRDTAFEKMISNGVRFVKERDWSYFRENVIRTTFENEEYSFILKVIDTTREKLPFYLKPFIWIPKEFAMKFSVILDKDYIDVSDVKRFDGYCNGLENILRCQEVLPRQEKPEEIKPEQGKKIVNPWEIDVRKIENIAGG